MSTTVSPSSPPGKKLPTRLQMMLAIFTIWTAVGVVLAVPDVLTGGGWPNFLAKVIEAWGWALLTPIILLVGRHISERVNRLVWRIPILVMFAVPFSFMHTYTAAVFLFPIRQVTWSPLRNPSYAVFYFIGGMVMYCAIIATMTTMQYYKQYLMGQLELERVQRKLLQSHLNTLRLQLEPHFLFNTLNAISSEVEDDPELARGMIEDLSALLRVSLDFKDRMEISLSQEVSFLEHYLAIQKIRFGDRLNVDLRIPPEMASALVPCMLLQPVVENAIRHGISKRTSGGAITILASQADRYVELRVLDDGVGLPSGWQMTTTKGLGLTATRERLNGLYPDVKQAFEIHRRDEGGVEVVMRVPLHIMGEGADE